MRWPFAISICALLPTLPSQIVQEWVPLSTFPNPVAAITYPPARARLFSANTTSFTGPFLQLELSAGGTVRRLDRDALSGFGGDYLSSVYDPVRRTTVASMSTFSAPPFVLATLATFDGYTWTTLPGWIEALPALAFDPASGNVLAVGGRSSFLSPVGTTRTVSSAGLSTLATLPVARFSTALAPSPNGGMVLFGGDTSATSGLTLPLADTWIFANNAWTGVAVSGPPARSRHTMLFDPQTNRTWLYGGNGASNVRLGDFWAWNGSGWSQAPTPPVPPLAFPSLVIDDGVIVLLGTTSTPTTLASHRLEFVAGTWQARPTITAPASRTEDARTFDAARGEIVKFSGQAWPTALSAPLDDTWTWNGEWTMRQPAVHPPGRRAGAMAFDAARGNCVLFGGFASSYPPHLDDTWTWDGVNWTQRNPATRPAGRRQHAMAYDPGHQGVVVFGGLAPSATSPYEAWRSDTWEWDGNTWSQLAGSPAFVSSPAMAYDEARGVMVLRTKDPQTSQFLTYELFAGGWGFVASGAIDGAMAYDPVEGAVVTIGVNGRSKLVNGSWVPLPYLSGVDPNVITTDGLLTDPLRHGLIVASKSVSLATAAPAQVTFLGSGCGGPPAPNLTCNTRPVIGAELRAEIDCGTSSGAFFAIALAQANVAIGGGCTVHVDSIALILPVVAGASGWATIDLPVPPSTTLVGLQLFAQAATTNPTLSLTNGLGLRIGF